MSFRQKLLVTLKTLPSNARMSSAATVTLENMNPCIKKMEYAVRGPLVIRATAIEKVVMVELRESEDFHSIFWAIKKVCF